MVALRTPVTIRRVSPSKPALLGSKLLHVLPDKGHEIIINGKEYVVMAIRHELQLKAHNITIEVAETEDVFRAEEKRLTEMEMMAEVDQLLTGMGEE